MYRCWGESTICEAVADLPYTYLSSEFFPVGKIAEDSRPSLEEVVE